MNSSASQIATSAAPAPVNQSQQYKNSVGRSEPKSNRFLVGASLTGIAIALAFGFWSVSRQLAPQVIISSSPVEEPNSALAPQKSVAVLPFENLSEDNQNAFLADGVQDDILSALSKIADLKVISGTSVSSYAPGSTRNLPKIAEALGVGQIVQGTVRQSGTHVRITAQLTDARTNTQLWSETYERDLGEVFAIQTDIVRSIVSKLGAALTPREETDIAERPTRDLAAYGLYVRAKSLIVRVALNGQIEERLREAVKLLEAATARDPDFYLAYCQLSAAHNYMYFFGLDHTPTRLAAADVALREVVRLRPEAGETHLARADFFYRCYLDYTRARAELARAQRSLPNNSEIFELAGYIDRRQGLWNESARNLERAIELDPRNFFMLQQIALSY
jgi:TolB-like protein